MVRVVRVVEVCQMAGDAGSRKPGEHVVLVALGAGHAYVSARQRELRLIVIENSALPRGGIVTYRTILWKTRCLVIWAVCVVKVREVAGNAGGRKPGEHIVLMALSTRDVDVSTGQGEFCRIVTERGALPTRCRVTDAAVLREARRLVIRVLGIDKIRKVARHACSRNRKLPVLVTLGAIDRCVRSGQGEFRGVVIELRIEPRIEPMAGLARRGKTRCDMIREFRRLKIIEMA